MVQVEPVLQKGIEPAGDVGRPPKRNSEGSAGARDYAAVRAFPTNNPVAPTRHERGKTDDHYRSGPRSPVERLARALGSGP